MDDHCLAEEPEGQRLQLAPQMIGPEDAERRERDS